ncbi:hypothetical protein E3N88_03166 [Mikania micrantha]|uniref:Uncharacterized protein n=1 Tax=Mikania micrantha TaxID=192012 RepID=A0A5N6Q8K6_9ASTR|nr:hypothetical protein E3N88_03166 [Mikania micrantha]
MAKPQRCDVGIYARPKWTDPHGGHRGALFCGPNLFPREIAPLSLLLDLPQESTIPHYQQDKLEEFIILIKIPGLK